MLLAYTKKGKGRLSNGIGPDEFPSIHNREDRKLDGIKAEQLVSVGMLVNKGGRYFITTKGKAEIDKFSLNPAPFKRLLYTPRREFTTEFSRVLFADLLSYVTKAMKLGNNKDWSQYKLDIKTYKVVDDWGQLIRYKVRGKFLSTINFRKNTLTNYVVEGEFNLTDTAPVFLAETLSANVYHHHI